MKVNIVPIVQRWNKIFEQLQNMTHSKTLEIGIISIGNRRKTAILIKLQDTTHYIGL
jgi:hypothetical protein